ncbi:MAG: hypothetical protein RIQ89_869 [Bacteroidota bacterium]|jgi:7,8-dihydroneopterin aldolase/epimerase/oxygenase
MQQLAVNKIRCYSHHGCLPEETQIGGYYEVDLILNADFTEAMHSDQLIHTIDYCRVYETVKKCMAQPSKLIEHVAARIGLQLLDNEPLLHSATVSVTKINPPLNGILDSVTFKHTSYRSDESKLKD